MDHHTETLKAAADLGSVGIIMATLMDWLPQAAAILTVLWLGARLYNEVMTAVYRARGRRIENGDKD